MRSFPLLTLAAALASACAHAPSQSPSAAPEGPPPTAETPEEPSPTAAPDAPPFEAPQVTAADPSTTVLVMEADDLGGGPDAIVAAPRRPDLPSMMNDIAMAPSR